MPPWSRIRIRPRQPNKRELERLRALSPTDPSSVAAAVDDLWNDEHIDAALQSGILDLAFVISRDDQDKLLSNEQIEFYEIDKLTRLVNCLQRPQQTTSSTYTIPEQRLVILGPLRSNFALRNGRSRRNPRLLRRPLSRPFRPFTGPILKGSKGRRAGLQAPPGKARNPRHCRHSIAARNRPYRPKRLSVELRGRPEEYLADGDVFVLAHGNATPRAKEFRRDTPLRQLRTGGSSFTQFEKPTSSYRRS